MPSPLLRFSYFLDRFSYSWTMIHPWTMILLSMPLAELGL
jgi:hypothetical protein